MQRIRSVPAVGVLAAACVLALVSGGSYAKGRYDATNADKVDGLHAVSAKASATQRSGKLVATNKGGRVPDSVKVGGYGHPALSTINIAPQAAVVSGSGSMTADGPTLGATSSSSMVVSFVLPPDRKAGDGGVKMDVVYREPSAGACAWYVYAEGLEGPDGPATASNIHNGGWQVPGLTSFDGPVAVPAGDGDAQKARFTWPFRADPGMFIQFNLLRDGANAADTCGAVTILGLMVRY